MGYSPWGHKESDTTEQLNTSLFFPPLRHSAWISGDNRGSSPRKGYSASNAFCPQRRKGNGCPWQVAGRWVAVRGPLFLSFKIQS